ncbi:MAG: hypothetical protein AB8D78_12040 [Akkermansiaceae bacterium]
MHILLLTGLMALLVDAEPVRISDPRITEASGFTSSKRFENCFWLINDSGGAPSLYLVDEQGDSRGTLTLKGIKNRDWEDLASFTKEGKSYLLIPDVGDNGAKRDQVILHVIAEPKDESSDEILELTATPDWSIRFQYEDGPRDCEGVAVDTQNQSIFLISKRDKQPAIYQLPLRRPEPKEVLIAKRVALLADLPLPPRTLPHPFASQPTGFDISPDGRHACVLTYRGVYLFSRSGNEPWPIALKRAPNILGAHGLPQAEAIGFSADGKTILVTSEGRKPKVMKFAIPLK